VLNALSTRRGGGAGLAMNSVSLRSGVKGIPNSIISRAFLVDFGTWRAITWAVDEYLSIDS
jgi:hypothetical protein